MRKTTEGMSASSGHTAAQPKRWRTKPFFWGVLVLLAAALVPLAFRFRADWQSRRMLQSAEEKWQKADYLGAVHDYERVVDLYPTSAVAPEAYYWKGVTALLYLNDSEEALEAFQKVIALEPPSDESRFGLKARRYLAETYELKLDRPTEAIGVYEGLIEVTPDREEAERTRYKIGELYESMGDFAQARVEWELLARDQPESVWAPSALYRIGGSYFMTGNCKSALKVYTVVFTRYPEAEMSPFAKFRAANCLEMGKQKEAAYTLYQELQDGSYPDQALIARKIAGLKRAPETH